MESVDLETIKNFYGKNPEENSLFLKEFIESMVLYRAAVKEITTKIEILNEEFQAKNKRNPIEHIKSRIKSPRSIFKKLKRNLFPVTIDSMKENLADIAGIRVVCSFIDDIYMVSKLFKNQDDIKIVSEKDYIKNPKPNGYRSLHLVIEIPIFLSEKTENVKVEIQIRTIAMDFWASLEHQLFYKNNKNVPEHVRRELRECADTITATDKKMQDIYKYVSQLDNLN